MRNRKAQGLPIKTLVKIALAIFVIFLIISFTTGSWRYFTKTFREALKGILPPKGKHTPKNLLRHYRLSHLCEYYNFDGLDLSNYGGWSVKTGMGMTGMTVSSNLDFYIHMAWRRYFPKLLRPIEQFI